MNVESVGLKFRGTEFAASIFVVGTQSEVVGVGGLVLNAVVNIVVRDAGACAERDLTAKVREEV